MRVPYHSMEVNVPFDEIQGIEYFELKEKSVTPENAGYDAVYVIPYTQDNLDETIQLYKRKIDYLYEKEGDVYYVVYIENCPNGHRVNSNPCWATYFLY